MVQPSPWSHSRIFSAHKKPISGPSPSLPPGPWQPVLSVLDDVHRCSLLSAPGVAAVFPWGVCCAGHCLSARGRDRVGTHALCLVGGHLGAESWVTSEPVYRVRSASLVRSGHPACTPAGPAPGPVASLLPCVTWGPPGCIVFAPSPPSKGPISMYDSCPRKESAFSLFLVTEILTC